MEISNEMISTFENLVRSYQPFCDKNEKLQSLIHELSVIILHNGSNVKENLEMAAPVHDNATTDPEAGSELNTFIIRDETKTKEEFSSFKMLEALSNSEILRETFKQLELRDLVNVRLVNRQWNELSSSVIRQGNLWTLNLNKVFKENPEIQDYDILKCIENSPRFPSTSAKIDLNFENSGRELCMHLLNADANTHEEPSVRPASEIDLEEFRLFKFLKTYGQHIHVFKMKCTGFEREETICDLFLRQLPNLQKFDFKGVYRPQASLSQLEDESGMGHHSLESLPELQLPSLRVIKYHETPPIILINNDRRTPSISNVLQTILKASPNLQEITYASVWLADAIAQSGKVNTVKYIWIDFEWILFNDRYDQIPHNMNFLARFADQKVQVEFLVVRDVDSQLSATATDSISKILHSSQKSLKKLKLPNHLIPQVIDTQCPLVFPNLKYLCVQDRFGQATEVDSDNLFPINNISPFPNVHHLRIGHPSSIKNLEAFYSKLQDDAKDLQDTIKPFPSVTTLEFTRWTKLCDNGKFVRPFLEAMFPNVTKVIVRDNVNFILNLLVNKTVDCMPKTVKSVEFPFLGLCLKNKIIRNTTHWVFSPTLTSSSFIHWE